MYGMQRDDVQHQLAVGMKESQAFETVNNRLEDQIEQKDRVAAGARDSCCVLALLEEKLNEVVQAAAVGNKACEV